MSFERLAVRAEVGATIPDDCPLNRGAANGAVLATAVGNLKLKMGGAYFTAGTKISICTGPLIADGCQ